MRYASVSVLAALALLTACSGGSMRPVYSGHEESTEGVPGFVKGKKVSPNVKLGQSYTVAGETYVPRHEPDYDETGLASWYGPGFHGGKTANGERFDAGELTAAHRTLPLPSVVRVTMLSTGKQVYVRLNDRGTFSKNRIIDLSRAAAEKIGLIRVGVAKVRVEYREKESQRFAELLAQGRDPKSIDLASEVLDYRDDESVDVARSDTRDVNSGGFWDNFRSDPEPPPPSNNPRVFASNATNEAVPVSEVVSADLAAPADTRNPPVNTATSEDSPFAVLEPAAAPVEVASIAPKERVAEAVAAKAVAPAIATGQYFVQLGAFSSQANADKLRRQYAQISDLEVVKKTNAAGQPLYHVRMGPYADGEAGGEAMEQLESAGADPRLVRE